MAVPALAGKRVVVVLGCFELGGAERQALLLARHLREQQLADVEVWGFNRTGPVVDLCEDAGLPWRVLRYQPDSGPAAWLLGLPRLIWRLRQARPDILLPYTVIPNVLCGTIWHLTGARICIWNQRDEGLLHPPTRIERSAVRHCPRHIANSDQGARFLIDTMGVPPSSVTVVRNGVEYRAPAHDASAWRARLEIEDGCVVACMVANLTRVKDHQTLLLAWREVAARLRAENRRGVLLLAGRFDDTHASLVALAKQLEIANSVRFLGTVSDVFGLLDVVDIGVFSSRSEGCPNGVLECMAAGLPVAGTDTQGVREALGPGGAPFLAPVGDSTALADCLLRLARDPALRARCGAENQDRIRSDYGAARMYAETVAVIDESMNSTRSSAKVAPA
jgi:glycosyltransferase involved in cell wall biosynthesis